MTHSRPEPAPDDAEPVEGPVPQETSVDDVDEDEDEPAREATS